MPPRVSLALERQSCGWVAVDDRPKVTLVVAESRARDVVGLDECGVSAVLAAVNLDDGAVRVMRQRVGAALRVRHSETAMCRRSSRKSNSGSDLESRSGEAPSENCL